MHRMAGTYVPNVVTRHARFARRSAQKAPNIVWKTCLLGCAILAERITMNLFAQVVRKIFPGVN